MTFEAMSEFVVATFLLPAHVARVVNKILL